MSTDPAAAPEEPVKPAPWDNTVRMLVLPAILSLLALLLFQSVSAAVVVFIFFMFCRSWQDCQFLVVAILVAVVFRSLAYEPFHIPSGSMESNLLVGDYLFVSKYSYGYSRFSFPLGPPIFHGRVMELRKPARGDVVVFRLPTNTKIDYIKRVMGLPGDHIQVKNGIVFINGKALPRQKADVYADTDDPAHPRMINRFRETLPEGRVITILKEREGGFANNTPEYVVPPGHYFMMGDNRDNSRDSRFLDEVGYVPEENIVGPADVIFFSTGGNAHLWEVWKWLPGLRFSRFFTAIH